MSYYFAAHGLPYPAEGEKTFVPAGLSIICFTDFGLKMDQAAAMMSLTNLTLKEELKNCHRDVIDSGGEIENRTLKALSDPEFRRLAGSAETEIEIQTMGKDWVPINEERLCKSPGPQGCKAPWHTCGGVLHYLQNKPGELRLICCRGTSSDSPVDQRQVTDDPNKPTDGELTEATLEYINELVSYVRDTPSKLDFFNGQFWAMPERSRLLLQADPVFQRSQRLYEAEALYADTNCDAKRFFEFCTDNNGVGNSIEWERTKGLESVTTRLYIQGTGGMECDEAVRQRAIEKHPLLESLWSTLWYPGDDDSDDNISTDDEDEVD